MALFMEDDHWNTDFAKSLIVYINGLAIPTPDEWGQKILDDHFLLLFNASESPLDFSLPPDKYGSGWRRVIDTANESEDDTAYDAGARLHVDARSMIVMMQKTQQ